MKVLVLFSGGKDSQACLIQACKEFGPANIEAIFCDTGWEHHLTYQHVHNVVEMMGVKLTILKSKIGGFENLCKNMKWFPDTTHRMCTVQLKIQPFIDFVLNQNQNLLIIQGIRAAESAARSKMPCSADYFQEYFDGTGRKLYRKKEVKIWCSKYKATVERPMLGASSQQIIDFILQNGQQPNPLYKRGASRVGCYPCIYSRLREIKTMRKDTEYVKRLINLEDEVNKLRIEYNSKVRHSSFFNIGKIPSRYCFKYGDGIPSVEDVIKYVSRDDAQLDLFDTAGETSCMSIYHGLCE